MWSRGLFPDNAAIPYLTAVVIHSFIFILLFPYLLVILLFIIHEAVDEFQIMVLVHISSAR